MTSHILSTLFKAQALLTVPDQGAKPGPERGAVDRNINEICFEEGYSPEAQNIWEPCHRPFLIGKLKTKCLNTSPLAITHSPFSLNLGCRIIYENWGHTWRLISFSVSSSSEHGNSLGPHISPR